MPLSASSALCLLHLSSRCSMLWAVQRLSDAGLFRSKCFSAAPVSAPQVAREEAFGTTIGSLVASAFELRLLFSLGVLGDPSELPLWDHSGWLWAMAVHIVLVEPIYYWAHRIAHNGRLYRQLHSHHHLSIRVRPLTSICFLPLEHLFYDVLFALPILGVALSGHGSYLYYSTAVALMVDLPNALGHANYEFMPLWWIRSKILSPIFYSAAYHTAHHTHFKGNFALFMPWCDMLWGTHLAAATEGHLARAIGAACDER